MVQARTDAHQGEVHVDRAALLAMLRLLADGERADPGESDERPATSALARRTRW